MKNNKLTLKKIPIEQLVEILLKIYEDGCDYIDLSGTNDDDQDTITITTKKEYYSEEFSEDKLSEEDINLLL